MTHQIVIKFPAPSLGDFDRFIALEERLIANLESIHDVDGHDYGQDEFNIFILTQNPQALVAKLLDEISFAIPETALSISKREISSDNVEIIWSKT